MSPKRIGVLISGSGTNLQAIIDNINSGNINGEIKLIISNRKDAYGLERGKLAGIESMYIPYKEFSSNLEYDKRLIYEFRQRDVDLIVLAGYLRILSKNFIEVFNNRIINIHPSLIPSFCGKNYYGKKVHEGVLKYGVKYTGATVHFVDEGTDTGPIILQDIVKVDNADTVEMLQKKVLNVEHQILVEAIRLFCDDKLSLEDRMVRINRE